MYIQSFTVLFASLYLVETDKNHIKTSDTVLFNVYALYLIHVPMILGSGLGIMIVEEAGNI